MFTYQLLSVTGYVLVGEGRHFSDLLNVQTKTILSLRKPSGKEIQMLAFETLARIFHNLKTQ